MAVNKHIMTRDEVLLAAGVTQEQINAIKTADSTVAVNLLDAIHERLISFVATQRVEIANLNNPLRVFEKGYAALNGGKLNGLFQEILISTRQKGDGLYGGKKYVPGQPTNPWINLDYGAKPLSAIFGINAKIERTLDYNRVDFLMALNNDALDDYIAGQLATLEAENSGSRYIIENQVINCEPFQYTNYADAQVFSDASSLNLFMQHVWAMQNYPESNTEFKRIPFNTTRRAMDLFIILESDFAYEFTQKYQFAGYNKPFMWADQDADTYGTERKSDTRLITVDKLLPTTLAENQILDPLNMTAATLPANTRLIGRIIDWKAVKFGIGLKTALTFPLDSRTSHYTEVQDACYDMLGAYVNVPLLISDNFSYDRVISVKTVSDTPAAASAKSK